MNRIIEKGMIADGVGKFVIEAPRIAKKRKAGNFVIIRVNEEGERIPLTIVDSDVEKGTITLIVQSIGKTTRLMNSLEQGDVLADVLGPLGHSTPIGNAGTVVCIGGGVGTAEVLPIAHALKEAGNYVISIIGYRNKDLVILEDEMKAASDELYVTSDDGSYGRHGLVTDQLKELIEQGRRLDVIYAIGPIPMMRAVSGVTKPYGIKTFVSLNPIMIDGTGMCGGCRVIVAGKTKFACVDGPEFDAHEVNFDLLISRNRAFMEQEKKALNHLCELYQSK